MNKTTKTFLLVLMVVIGLLIGAVIAYEILTDVRGVEVNNTSDLVLASANLTSPEQRSRILRVDTGDTIVCANGNRPGTTEVEAHDLPALLIDCDELAPTLTPSPTITPAPEPTITPSPTPPTSIPLCDNHDMNQYHGLLAPDESCHYNHTHGDNIFTPDYDLFPAWPVTTTVSYPWQTVDENLVKHQGYKNHGGSTPNEDCVVLKGIPNVQGCIVAWRIQFHVVGGARGAVVRYHSFYAQFKVRNQDGSFGYIGTGGWSDFGILHCPYKAEHCPLSSDPTEFNTLQPPYRAFRQGEGDGLSQWNSGCYNASQVPCDTNQMASYDWWTKDDWGGVNPDDLTELVFSTDPDRNHSTLRFYEFTAHVEQFGPGRINYLGYTDLNGEVDETCTETGDTCVPLVIINVDAGLQVFRTVVGTAGDPLEDRYFREFDLSPIGESWIEYPN